MFTSCCSSGDADSTVVSFVCILFCFVEKETGVVKRKRYQRETQSFVSRMTELPAYLHDAMEEYRNKLVKHYQIKLKGSLA